MPTEALAVREEAGIVRASGDVVAAIREYQTIQAGLDKSMPEAIMKISGRPFRKKQYWRAIATAFNLHVVVTHDERAESADGDWGYLITCRATAPNGRTVEGDGACFASEKRNPVQRTVHNIRSHAHTRAFNRAVSNLVGFGEVSAEEAERDEFPEPGAHDGPEPPDSNLPDNMEVITEPQRKRLYAIGMNRGKAFDATKPECEAAMKEIVQKHGFAHSKDITRDKYEAIVADVEKWEPKS